MQQLHHERSGVYRSLAERRSRVGVALGLVVGGALAGCSDTGQPVDKHYGESQIVAGVPAQVMKRVSSLKRAPGGRTFDNVYYLNLAQCKKDVDNVLAGNAVPESSNQNTETVDEGCVLDSVRVTGRTYQASSNGYSIVISGVPGERIDKSVPVDSK